MKKFKNCIIKNTEEIKIFFLCIQKHKPIDTKDHEKVLSLKKPRDQRLKKG